MPILASHFGPSEKEIWFAVLVLLTPAAIVGLLARSPLLGLILGGLTSGGLTFLWLVHAIAFAVIFTPIFAIVGGLVGGFFGCLVPPRKTKSSRMHIEMSNPFEPVDAVDDNQRQDQESDNSQSAAEQERSM